MTELDMNSLESENLNYLINCIEYMIRLYIFI